MGTKAQALLLRELYSIVPDNSQLFLASHSLGFMSEAVKMAKDLVGEVAFLDFGSHDFDNPVVMEPVEPSREFWRRTLVVALDEMAALVAPSKLVICEGSIDGYDAKCYRAVFASELPDVDFVSVGNSHDASTDKIGLTSALQTITSGTEVIRVRDRDLANDGEVELWRSQGVRTLNRRHIESYLFDAEVLEMFCERIGRPEEKGAVVAIREECIRKAVSERGKDPDDIKAASGEIYIAIRKRLSLTGGGTTARAFAETYLAPSIKPGSKVYGELYGSIFGDSNKGHGTASARF